MRTTIEKRELLGILEENKRHHRQIFQEAVEGYEKRATELLQEHIDRIRSGKLEAVYVSLPRPAEHTSDYERVIRMVELHRGDTVDLSEQDVANFIMDDWAWKRAFLQSNATYSSTASTVLSSLDD